MRPIVVVVADVLSHQSFQMPLVQNDPVIQQVSAAASHPAFRNAVLPRATESSADGLASHLSHERQHVSAELGVAVEQQESLTSGSEFCRAPTRMISSMPRGAFSVPRQ